MASSLPPLSALLPNLPLQPYDAFQPDADRHALAIAPANVPIPGCITFFIAALLAMQYDKAMGWRRGGGRKACLRQRDCVVLVESVGARRGAMSVTGLRHVKGVREKRPEEERHGAVGSSHENSQGKAVWSNIAQK
ncbi:hypothetical protein KSP40_PGU010559 [Platanthera guangdongensis]|uniref:Uncharacterized protein n=1 Tax=Platanthera guangdongensis TaxID=2320717 RepID=A0ABR2MS11_9ASPA